MSDHPYPVTVDIDGHKVDATKADLFYNASDGSRVSDEQWDEQKRRLEAGERGEYVVDVPMTDRLPEGHTFGADPSGEK